MIDPSQLYSVDEDVAAGLAGTRPVLVQQLDGFVDAGQAGKMLTSHLLNHLDHEVVAVFDHDQLHDYRSRRPVMSFDTNEWRAYTDFALLLHKVTDERGESFLLFTGPEPDVQWERTAAALVQLIDRFSVRLSVSVHGIPMAVPHTRPVTFTAHATDPALVASYRSWIDRVEVPASFTGLVEWRLGQRSQQAMGLAVHVPHYLAQAAFPAATVTLAEHLVAASGLAVPMDPLRKAAEDNLSDIAGEMSESSEVQELVGSLEAQYDALQRDGVPQVPSADEIGAEFERFLAEQDPDDEQA